MPMMNFRLVQPSILVDINRIVDLDIIQIRGARLSIGALVRHRMTGASELVQQHIPVLHHTMKHVAHLTVRNRGTFCGSICHADSAAEMPMMSLLLNGIMHIASPRGRREVPAQDFFIGAMATVLEPDEFVTEVEVDVLPGGTGWGFHEFARRHGDYALAAVAVTMQRHDCAASGVRIGVMGVGEISMRMPQVEEMLEGREINSDLLKKAVEALQAELEPNSDLHASADYRRHLAGALAGRAIIDAWSRSEKGTK